MKFQTDYLYTDRETKAQYVWRKYQSLLNGRILDVGADECYLKHYLPKGAEYIGIGLGGTPDYRVDLEKESIPFGDNSFDCVLCLDVLEHLENIHEVFDEVCRVTGKNVIIALPNPWNSLLNSWKNGEYRPGQPIKYYGLPVEKPIDRHKWFFSIEEAENFIRYRAEKNQMHIIQMDSGGTAFRKSLYDTLRFVTYLFLFRGLKTNTQIKNTSAGTLWVVLEKMMVPKRK